MRSAAKNVIVSYERLPAKDVLAEGFEPDILGLFSGDPHGSELANDMPSPPIILLYLDNLWDYAEEDEAAFREEVRITYLHELGHYFGMIRNNSGMFRLIPAEVSKRELIR